MFDYQKKSFVTIFLWTISIISFGVYLLFSSFNIFDEKSIWVLDPKIIAKQGHDFPSLALHTKQEIITYLYKGDIYTSQLKTPLLAAMEISHCVKKDTENCNELRFYKMKKEYYFFINLDMTRDEIIKYNLDFKSIQIQLNRLFRSPKAIGTHNYSPIINFVTKKNDSDVIINISLNKNNIVDAKPISTRCNIVKTIEKNVLTAATISFDNTDIAQGIHFNACENYIRLSFYDMLGASVSYKMSIKDTDIYAGLAIEYYRWLAINNKYPKTKNQLIQSIDEYSNYIYSKF